jgi:8-oxo-dGTP diphosphatase
MAVFVFIRDADAILLVRQNYAPQYWSLPGGVVEAGETLEQAAVREAKEETGLDIRLRRVVALYSKLEEDALAITFDAEATGGKISPSSESLECRYFPLDDLPDHVRGHFAGRVRDYLANKPSAIFRQD